nr:hypothetical protein L203_00846 [Cryptococcus depauperatus CBS 7841]
MVQWVVLYRLSWVSSMSTPLGGYRSEASSPGSWTVPCESQSDRSGGWRGKESSRGCWDCDGIKMDSVRMYRRSVLGYNSSASAHLCHHFASAVSLVPLHISSSAWLAVPCHHPIVHIPPFPVRSTLPHSPSTTLSTLLTFLCPKHQREPPVSLIVTNAENK